MKPTEPSGPKKPIIVDVAEELRKTSILFSRSQEESPKDVQIPYKQVLFERIGLN